MLRALMKNLFILAVLVAGLTACKKQPKVEPSKAQANAQTAAVSDNTSGSVLPGDIMDQVPRTEADVAWAEVEKAAQPPEYPDEWSQKQPTKEEITAFERSNSELAAKAADKARDFYKKYPADARAGDAKSQEYRLLSVAVQLGATNRLKDVQALETERLKDPNLDEDARLELRMQQVQRTMASRKDDKPAENLAE